MDDGGAAVKHVVSGFAAVAAVPGVGRIEEVDGGGIGLREAVLASASEAGGAEVRREVWQQSSAGGVQVIRGWGWIVCRRVLRTSNGVTGVCQQASLVPCLCCTWRSVLPFIPALPFYSHQPPIPQSALDDPWTRTHSADSWSSRPSSPQRASRRMARPLTCRNQHSHSPPPPRRLQVETPKAPLRATDTHRREGIGLPGRPGCSNPHWVGVPTTAPPSSVFVQGRDARNGPDEKGAGADLLDLVMPGK
jgi:hypothetical protein